MSTASKLEQWRNAGLIDAATAERILAWERGRRRPLMAYALGGLGALTVVIGIISVVAANWEELGRGVKLAMDVAVLAGLAFGVWRVQGRWAREILVILYFGATLASIALISQVYQLGGDVHTALLLWMALATPMVALGRTWLLGAIWLVGLTTTVGYSLDALVTPLDDHLGFAIVIGTLSAEVVALILGGNARWLRERRPEFAQVFELAGWAGFVILTSVAQQVWYSGPGDELTWSVPVPLLLGALLVWRAPALLAEPRPAVVRTLRIMVSVAVLTSMVALLPHPDLDWLAVLSFIGLWVAFAAACHQTGRIGLLNAATAVIALRVVIAYIELFGSLLETGLAMIFGGLLTIGLAWLWRRLARTFKGGAAQGGEVQS